MRFVFVFCFFSFSIYSQVGIGTTSPDISSTLHLEDATKGFLVNKVALVNVNSNLVPVNLPATGLLVYNTNTTTVGGQGVGFYFWNGTQWQKLITSNDNNDWTIVGNAGTNPTNNFIGTTDNQDFVVRTNNTEKLRV